MILTQVNQHPSIPLMQWHVLDIPSACPVSGNPQAGSFLMLAYTPKACFLEVYSLRKYLESYVGGREGIRDMEGMIQAIAQDCANAIGVNVLAGAYINLQRWDGMRLFAWGLPCAG
jgi:NADPH-dependent 7-cyano-7-deazaguanine reductase QueF